MYDGMYLPASHIEDPVAFDLRGGTESRSKSLIKQTSTGYANPGLCHGITTDGQGKRSDSRSTWAEVLIIALSKCPRRS